MTSRLAAISVVCRAALLGVSVLACVDAPPSVVESATVPVVAPAAPSRALAPEAAARPRHFDPRALSAILNAPPAARFTNARGVTIATDFPPDRVEREIGDDLIDQCAALAEIFGPVDLSRLLIAIHGDAEHSVAGVPVNAVHREGEVHLFVGEGDALSVDAGAHLRHELVHAWLFLSGKRPPRWLDEGLAQALSALGRDGDGELELLPRSDFVTVFGKLRALDRTPRLLELLDSTLDYPDPARLGAFYIASWSFTRYALDHGVGSLRERVDDLLRATRVELIALGPGWLADPATTDPVAAWLPFAGAEDRARGDRGERALEELAVMPSWLVGIRSLARSHPVARERAARLLSLAPIDDSAFELARSLGDDAESSVRRAIARSIYSNDAWVKGATAQLASFTPHPTLRIPATLARALGGDVKALRSWLSLAESLPRDEAIDALLVLKRVLPDDVPGLDVRAILENEFDVRGALARLTLYLAEHSDTSISTHLRSRLTR